MRGPACRSFARQPRPRAHLVALVAADTSQPESTIARDVERERAFTAEEARAYGLVDDLFVRRVTN